SSSLRRECQIRRYRDDIQIQNLRGNVDTRLAKLQEKKYDAIILAAAGLKRLDLAEWITSYLSPEVSLPAIAQGTIGIECRSDDSEIRAIISAINHGPTWIVTQTERALNKRLQGDCNTPMAGFAQLGENQITLRALIGSTDGQTILTANKQGSLDSPVELGYTVAEDMLKQGAAALLKTDTS
ncbi:MAG: hydroxymethylbilane synthase, partial [Gammaproteobacteria bacterium]|nr:hydroxymethylbilane synthase [Gammaproteobacteria bacterium]